MTRIALGLEYDGCAFNGFQYQSHAPSVQGALENALSRVADAPVRISAAGRTDAGVHATAQVVAFDSPVERPLSAWVRGTNALSPPGVAVLWARPVPEGFHPRFQATARRYMYLFYDTEITSPLISGRAVLSPPLDDEAMHRACRVLIGEQDFSAFRAAGCQSATAYRCVHQVCVHRAGGFVVLDITANAFLLHMVRNIAGSLWKIGQGADEGWMGELLLGRDRKRAAPTGPAQGLYLVHVRYPDLAFPPGRLPGLLRALGDLSRF
ncbi:MAG: tRNA pseudouridine(38-40) synthase TruA [Pseudomonadales bacterium]|jgi:tRNA pseudouridine38-40 synthase